MAGEINKAVSWAVSIANDDQYGYVFGAWGPPNWDCGHFIIDAWEKAGVPVKSNGAGSTSSMFPAFTKCGFTDVTSTINLDTGAGTKKGDVLLNTTSHAAMVREDGGAIVHASSPSNGICCRSWYSKPWDYVLRYSKDNSGSSAPKKKIFLNPGHGGGDSGACGCGYQEQALTREVVKMVEANLKDYADVTVYDYSENILSNLNKGWKWSEYEYFLSVHFDADGGSGTTVYYTNRSANAFEEALASAVANAGGFKNNGVKKHWVNLGVLRVSDKCNQGGTTGSLIEICYIDNQSDVDKYQSNKKAIAKAISDTMISQFGLTSGGNSIKYTDFPKYELSESTIRAYAGIIVGECGGEDVLACRQMASLYINRNEVYYGRSSTEEALKKIVFGHEGIGSGSWDDEPTQIAIDAVRHVISGKRVLPRYVTNNDCMSDINYPKDRSSYRKMQTEYKSRFMGNGETNTFYCFCGSKEDGDVLGYRQSDYEKYKDDVIWTEGAESSGSSSENTEKEYHFADTNEKILLHPTLFSQKELHPIDNNIHIFLNNEFDITNYSGDISWQNSKRTLATTFKFTTAKTDNKYIADNIKIPENGDIIRYYEDETELFRGMIIDSDYGSRTKNTYTIVDAGWWLNKSTDTYQFTSANSFDCLNKILTDLSIPIVYINPNITAPITGVYINKNIADLILEILDLNGGQYNFDFVPEGIRIYQYGEYIANPKFKFASNTFEKDSLDYRGEEEHTLSIDEMKNSIKIISDTDVLTVAKDTENYDKYGFLQEVIQIDPSNVADIQQYAQDRLAIMAKPSESFGFEILENLGSYTRAGETIKIGKNEYVIESTDHSISKGIHHTKLKLWRWRTVG